MKIKEVKNIKDAKDTEKFVFEALKPGGFAYDPIIPIPSLKDKLAWLSWANLKRGEQPTFIIREKGNIIAGIFGEPVETTFDKGESEIQELLVKPGKESDDIYLNLLKYILDFYKKNKAKQVHFWILKKNYQKGKIEKWEKLAIEKYGFEYKGFERVSKWSGKEILKIEKYF